MSGRALAIAGGLLFAAMTVLMIIGTTDVALFVVYGALAVVGGGLAAAGRRLEARQVDARLDRERR